MSTSDKSPAHRAARWFAMRSRSAAKASCPRPEPHPAHRYFTDGVNLYRFVGWVNRSVSAMLAELEDCRSLEVVVVSAEDLARSTLRPVPIQSTT